MYYQPLLRVEREVVVPGLTNNTKGKTLLELVTGYRSSPQYVALNHLILVLDAGSLYPLLQLRRIKNNLMTSSLRLCPFASLRAKQKKLPSFDRQ